MTSKNFIPRSTVMGDKLRNLLPGKSNGNKHQKNGRNDHQRPMPAPKGADGVNHINIAEDSVTELGRCLAHSTVLKFSHKKFGHFSNIESFWHYIRSEEHDDRIRNMTGKALKEFAKMLHTRRVVNFIAIILDANWQKVNQYPELKEALKETTLPFECYNHYKRQDGVKIRPTYSYWLIPGFEEIRKALQENRQPNFSEFLDNPDIDLFDDVFPKDDSDIVPASSIVEPTEATVAKVPNKALAALLQTASSPEPVVEVATIVEESQPVEQEPVVEVAVISERIIPDEAMRLGEFVPFDQPPAGGTVVSGSEQAYFVQQDEQLQNTTTPGPVSVPASTQAVLDSIGGTVNTGI